MFHFPCFHILLFYLSGVALFLDFLRELFVCFVVLCFLVVLLLVGWLVCLLNTSISEDNEVLSFQNG